ncbi:hypothetical protein M408DRAFT_139912 [Serendipita vermifera MAFF 305830]|uniref:Cytochrome P450 n=1 Tax=Serendipita vermifera MAFF 305830 TaxID=933852 RepID=A0A0C2XGS7_SERVB|nr:hypothetical protein M408DRAFT_139912 [Serendipita vermifera MAFF 305830]
MMEQALDRLAAESPLKLAGVTLSVATIGYLLVQGLKKLTDKSSASKLPAPPGPPRHFLLGNMSQFPKDHFYQRFCEWQKEYGDIVSIELPGTPMIVLNSYEVVQELLNKRPNTTAGRKIGYMALEVMGSQWHTTVLQPGAQHSYQRKMLRRAIGPQRVGSHDLVIEKNVTKLMLTLQKFEGNPHRTFLQAVGGIVIEITYGNKLATVMTKDLSFWNNELQALLNRAFVSFWFVDIFHFLRFIPSWMPGAEFRRIGDRATWLSKQVRYAPYEKAKELHAAGELGHSLTADILDEFGPSDDAMDALAIMYMAGSDTTSASIMAFVDALLLFPEIAKKVSEEVNRATDGGARLPRISDRPNLPYSEAVWKEAFRWNSFTPIAIPHVNTQDEVINGYFIKAGTVINVNNGFVLNDPRIWGDPETFRPERFLGDDAKSLPNPLNVTFGFGNRVCAGMYLADKIGFHVGTTIAALYDVCPLPGKSRPNPALAEYTDGIFRCVIMIQCMYMRPLSNQYPSGCELASRDDSSQGIVERWTC